MSHPHRYNDVEFINSLAHGTGFVWPFETPMAYTTATSDSMCRFTPELMLRTTNLRSYTLTKDFLDDNPDLRGLAPQLEPSVTNIRLSSQSELEALYWKMLRRKYESFLKEKR